LLTNGKSIVDIAVEKQADEIVIAMDEKRGNLPVRELLDARLKGIDVLELMEFLERETGKIRVDLVNPGWLIFSPGFRISKLRGVTERMLDVISSTILVAVSWPIMLLVALAIKIEDGLDAPVFYRQCRVGKSSSFAVCMWTPRPMVRPGGPRRTTSASRASAISCAMRGWTSCRRSSTCCAGR
jgi:hypothetical protein